MKIFPELNVNRISDKYRAELDERKLRKGQLVQYRLLGGRLNPDPEERRKKEIIWPQSECIVCSDRINDPYDGKPKDIGVIKSIDDKGRPEYEKLYINARETNGYFFINGGNVAQERFYDFIECCNENESNPYRDENVIPRFRRIDAVKEAKKKNDYDDDLTDMLYLVKGLSLSEKREVANAYGWDAQTDEGVITSRIREVVKKDPTGFKKLFNNKIDLGIRATINEALKGGVITHDPMQNKYTFTKTEEVICTLTRSESVEPNEQFLEWVKTNPSGNAVLKNIKRQLGSK